MIEQVYLIRDKEHLDCGVTIRWADGRVQTFAYSVMRALPNGGYEVRVPQFSEDGHMCFNVGQEIVQGGVDKPRVQTYKELICTLHTLVKGGRGDGDSADAVREEMDIAWQLLSPDEQNECRAFAGVAAGCESEHQS